MRLYHAFKLQLLAVLTLLPLSAAWSQERVSETVHNLSASGPGKVRAPSEQQVCVFCHTPHTAGGMRPLWNRELPISNYAVYQSSTLDAQPGQPTGASKLCLSCHDGTIALGSVLSRTDRIRVIGGEFMPSGLTNLGTDLSDDHPISFHYTSGLAAGDGQLADPLGLPREIKLDKSGQLQCTSCHDPHHNVVGNFLVMANEFGALCTACHTRFGWTSSSHRMSNATVSGASNGDWPYLTVAENACRSCHRSHTAGGHERLLIFEAEEENCLGCHDGQVAKRNIRAELDKPSSHDPRRYIGLHDPVEVLTGDRDHVECVDCHNPHAVEAVLPDSNYRAIGATLTKVRGVTVGGAQIDEARYEYEVCFRCHGDQSVNRSRRVVRQADTANLRLKFSPSSRSFHPVVGSASRGDAVSLIPGLPTGSLIRCTDCHNSDSTRRTGGTGPDGPHGSVYDFLLERNYTVIDNRPESEFEYALCYKCHRRASILGNQSFVEHRRHIVDETTPCSACHDPHGVNRVPGSRSDQTHLINFDTTIVQPDPTTWRLEFEDRGARSGSCTLRCHGSVHRGRTYGRTGAG